MTHSERPDRSPAIAELLDDAYVAPVGVDTEARHLWAIHAEANRQAAEHAPQRPEPAESLASRRIPRAAIPVLALVMVMSSSGMALAASRSSLPGDVLYPVKRGTEQAQLIFARNPEARAQLQLSFARTRLEEIRQIAVTRPQHVPALVAAINVTLSQVELAAPEDSERVRREIDAQIASLELTTPEQVTSATEVPAGEPTASATELPTSGAATATTTPSAEPTATASASAEPTDIPSTEDDGATAEPVATDSTSDADPTASPTPSDSPTPSTSPTPTTSPSDGPVVTSRPHTDDGPGGTSRTEEPSEEPSEEPTGDGEVQPYTRPDS